MTLDILFYAIIVNVSVIVGAILGYLLSKREKRKERLIEGIYRPLLAQIGQFFDKIGNGEMHDLGDFEQIRQDGLYFVIDEKEKEMTEQIYHELVGYKDIHDASTARSNQLVKKEIEEFVKKDNLKKYLSGDIGVNYRAFISHKYMGSANLRDCILIDKTPVQFLIEKRSILKDSDIDSNISGHRVERSLADAIAKSALEKAKEDKNIKEARSQRQIILKDLQELIKMLTKKVV